MKAMAGIGVAADRPTVVTGTDGLARCGWAVTTRPDLVAFHDVEWGTPVHDDAGLFEALVMTYFENGLSWQLIHAKRTAMHRAFRDFDIDAVAAMTAADVEALMLDPTIVRHRGKIEATIHNATVAQRVSLEELVWRYADQRGRPLRDWSEARVTTPQMVELEKALRDTGFRFVGPMVTRSFMRTVGVDNGHFEGCYRAS